MKPILPAGEKTTIGQSQDNMRLTRVIERWTRLHSFPIRKVHIKPRLEYGFAKCFIDLGCMLSPLIASITFSSPSRSFSMSSIAAWGE